MKKKYLLLIICLVIGLVTVSIMFISSSHENEVDNIDKLTKDKTTNPTGIPSQNPQEIILDNDSSTDGDKPSGETYTEDEIPDNNIYLKDAYEIFDTGLLDKGAEHIIEDIRMYLDSKDYHGLGALKLVPNSVYLNGIQSLSFILQIEDLKNKYLKVFYDVPTDKFEVTDYEYHVVHPLSEEDRKKIEEQEITYETKFVTNLLFDKAIYKKLIHVVSKYTASIHSNDYYELYTELIAVDKMKEMVPHYDEFVYLQADKQFHEEWNPPENQRIFCSVAMYYKFDQYYLVKMGYQSSDNGKKGPCFYKWITIFEENGEFKMIPEDINCSEIWLSRYL